MCKRFGFCAQIVTGSKIILFEKPWERVSVDGVKHNHGNATKFSVFCNNVEGSSGELCSESIVFSDEGYRSDFFYLLYSSSAQNCSIFTFGPHLTRSAPILVLQANSSLNRILRTKFVVLRQRTERMHNV